MNGRMMKKTISFLFLSLIFLVFSSSVVFAGGILNNGSYGISIDINSAPYSTTYAARGNAIGTGVVYGPYGCSWFASARINQLTGKDVPVYNGVGWWNNAERYGFSRGTTAPTSGKAVICYKDEVSGDGVEFAHVEIIEGFSGGNVIISTGGYTPAPNNGYCAIFMKNASSYLSQSKIQGFVYIENAIQHNPLIASGTCGDNLTWKLDNSGTLTIDGEGEMTTYNYSVDKGAQTPWVSYSDKVFKVVIGNRVKSISPCSFFDFDSLKRVEILNGSISICRNVFYDNDNLTDVILPDDMSGGYIGWFNFAYCPSLVSFKIPNGIKGIWRGTFAFSNNLKSITIPRSVTEINNRAFAGCNNVIFYCYSNSCAESFAKEYKIPYVLIDSPQQASTKESVFKVSSKIVKRGKKTVIKISSNSGAKLAVKAKNARAKNKKYVKIKNGKLTFTKKAVKGVYKFTVTSPANGKYKKTSKTIKIVVK